MLGFDRITFNPSIMGGRACIRGMRITVSLIVNLFAIGMSDEEILEDYPYLEKDDVSQAIQYQRFFQGDYYHNANSQYSL